MKCLQIFSLISLDEMPIWLLFSLHYTTRLAGHVIWSKIYAICKDSYTWFYLSWNKKLVNFLENFNLLFKKYLKRILIFFEKKINQREYHPFKCIFVERISHFIKSIHSKFMDQHWHDWVYFIVVDCLELRLQHQGQTCFSPNHIRGDILAYLYIPPCLEWYHNRFWWHF